MVCYIYTIGQGINGLLYIPHRTGDKWFVIDTNKTGCQFVFRKKKSSSYFNKQFESR